MPGGGCRGAEGEGVLIEESERGALMSGRGVQLTWH